MLAADEMNGPLRFVRCFARHCYGRESAVRHFFVTVFLCLSLLTGIMSTRTSAGDCPRYLVLQPLYGGQATCLSAHAYAYGWFGETPSSASTWHRTYDGTGLWWTYTPAW